MYREYRELVVGLNRGLDKVGPLELGGIIHHQYINGNAQYGVAVMIHKKDVPREPHSLLTPVQHTVDELDFCSPEMHLRFHVLLNGCPL